MSRRERSTFDYNSLQKELLSGGALFTDPQFPPNVRSMYYDGRIPLSAAKHPRKVVWKRPADLEPNPMFIVDGMSRHDIKQGELGNCWFIAGAAILASTHRDYFERVVPPDQGFRPGQYTGMFKFNFWWYGKWVEVIIDDCLPTNGSRLIYSSNRERPNEFWPSLLEKAYAKLRGCYEALIGGKLQDALVDMTGGISEVIDLKQKNEVPLDLYSFLYTSHKMRTLMGCSISRPEHASTAETEMINGLIMGHAYSITGFRQIPTGRRSVSLLRLRNPWGQDEWKGAWSDQSPEMAQLSKQLKEELNFYKKDDGEFWISYDDFMYNFHQIQLCHLQPDAFIAELADNDVKQSWNVTVYHDAWIRGVTAGGRLTKANEHLYWKNPQFYITLESPDVTLGHGDDCTLIVSLMEKEKNNQSNVAIGFDIYRLKNPVLRPLDDSRAPENALLYECRSDAYVPWREVTKRFELKPGTYVIIPTTYETHKEAEFMLRLFTERRVGSGLLDEKIETRRSVPSSPRDFITDTFERHAGSDRRLDAQELSTFLEDISAVERRDPLKFPVESCRSIVTLLSEDKSGFLSLNEVKQAWRNIKAYRDVFKQFDVNRSNSVDTYELGTLFTRLGFPMSHNVLTSIVRRYGGRNNQISLPDFVMVICKLTSLFASFHAQQKKRGVSGEISEFTRNEFLEVTMFT